MKRVMAWQFASDHTLCHLTFKMLSWRFLCNLIDIHEYNVTRDTLRLSWLNQSAPRTPCTTCWCMLPATLLVILYHFGQHGRSPHRYSWDLYKGLHNLCMTSGYKLSRLTFSVTSSWWGTWIAKIIKISGGPWWEDVKKLTRWCDWCFETGQACWRPGNWCTFVHQQCLQGKSLGHICLSMYMRLPNLWETLRYRQWLSTLGMPLSGQWKEDHAVWFLLRRR